jgi:hypothetical protein
MSPFDPTPDIIEPARAPAARRQMTDSAALFGCPICGRNRLNPYAIAYDKTAVVSHGYLHACSLCGDGCLQ